MAPVASAKPVGRRLGLAHQGQFWIVTARKLLHASPSRPTEVWLGVVAAHRAVANACQLIDGSKIVPPDSAAVLSWPTSVEDLRAHRERLERFRNEILHLPEKLDDDREVGLDYSGRPIELTITATVRRRRGTARVDSITRSSIEAVLDDLEPWFQLNVSRLLAEHAAGAP